MDQIEYNTSGLEGLEEIRHLWEQLNQHHKAVSTHFADRFDRFSFQERVADLRRTSTDGLILVETAVSGGVVVGYCVTTLTGELDGEIQSLFVSKDYRGQGVADRLMQGSVGWLDKNDAHSRCVNVVHGNERSFGFYARHGFLPASTRLTVCSPDK